MSNIEKAKQAAVIVINGESYRLDSADEFDVYCTDENSGIQYKFAEDDIQNAVFLKLVQF